MHNTKICPQCGKQMSHDWSDELFMSDPPKRAYVWWCNCGYIELGGTELVEGIESEKKHTQGKDANE